MSPLRASTPTPVLALTPGVGQSAAVLRLLSSRSELVHVAGEVYLPAGTEDWPAARVEALRMLVPQHAVVAMTTAVWARGGPGRRGEAQPRVELVIATDGQPPEPVEGVQVSYRDLPAGDVETLAGVRLTSMARTAHDLQGRGAAEDQPALRWALARLSSTGSR